MDKSKLIEFAVFIIPFSVMLIGNLFLPRSIAPVVSVISLPFMLLVIWFQEVAIRDKVNKYPNIEFIVMPQKKKYQLFIKSGKSRNIEGNIWSTTLELAYNVKMEDYGEVKTVRINHAGKWNQRTSFTPGLKAKYLEQWVDHPQVEIIVVHQLPHQGRMIIREGVYIPTFVMDMASKDDPNSKGIPIIGTPEKYPECIQACKKVKDINRELIEYKSQSAMFHEDSASSGEIIDQKNIETTTLLNAKTGSVDYAIEMLLALYRACGTIDKTIKAIKGDKFRFEKWMLIPITLLALLAYFWSQPKAMERAQAFIASPQNQVFLIIFVVVIFGGYYYIKRYR